jgi:hypothetical protein
MISVVVIYTIYSNMNDCIVNTDNVVDDATAQTTLLHEEVPDEASDPCDDETYVTRNDEASGTSDSIVYLSDREETRVVETTTVLHTTEVETSDERDEEESVLTDIAEAHGTVVSPGGRTITKYRSLLLTHRSSLDICGVDKDDYGRTCRRHYTCGHFLDVKDILCCKNVMQLIKGVVSDVVKVNKVNNKTGLASCHVGYVPERYFHWTPCAAFDGLYLVIEFDYRLDDLSTNHRFSYRNSGLVQTKFIKENPLINGHDCTANKPIVVDQKFIDGLVVCNVDDNEATLTTENENRLEGYLQ